MSFVLGVIPSVVCVCEDGVAVGVVCNVVSLGSFHCEYSVLPSLPLPLEARSSPRGYGRGSRSRETRP